MKSSNSVSNFLLNVREVEIAFGVIKCRNDVAACPKQAETEIGNLLGESRCRYFDYFYYNALCWKKHY